MSMFQRPFLVNNLSFIYRVIVASAPLLKFGAHYADGDLKKYYMHHFDEEVGHDEMLRNDLFRLGVAEIDRFHAAAEFAGSQYYLIAHEHPAMLLGYMQVLEGNTVPRETVDQLETHYGVELNALRHHCDHDPKHIKEVVRQIEAQDEQTRDLIRWNAECTMDFFNGMVKGF